MHIEKTGELNWHTKSIRIIHSSIIGQKDFEWLVLKWLPENFYSHVYDSWWLRWLMVAMDNTKEFNGFEVLPYNFSVFHLYLRNVCVFHHSCYECSQHFDVGSTRAEMSWLLFHSSYMNHWKWTLFHIYQIAVMLCLLWLMNMIWIGSLNVFIITTVHCFTHHDFIHTYTSIL